MTATSPQDISNDKKVFTKSFIISYKIERNKYCKKLRLLKVYICTVYMKKKKIKTRHFAALQHRD